MEREQIVEEMVSIMGEWAIENRMCWNSKHAESLAKCLIEKNVLKISDGAVVLTKEEYEWLKALPEKVHDEMDEKMKEEIAIEKRMGEDKLERFENNMKNVLEIEKENVRKETAKDIFDGLMKAERGDGFVTYTWSKSIIKQLAKQYGVEVKE